MTQSDISYFWKAEIKSKIENNIILIYATSESIVITNVYIFNVGYRAKASNMDNCN